MDYPYNPLNFVQFKEFWMLTVIAHMKIFIVKTLMQKLTLDNLINSDPKPELSNLS